MTSFLVGNHANDNIHALPNQKVQALQFVVHTDYVGKRTNYANDICLVRVEPIALSAERDIEQG